jgi:hypothetical protein
VDQLDSTSIFHGLVTIEGLNIVFNERVNDFLEIEKHSNLILSLKQIIYLFFFFFSVKLLVFIIFLVFIHDCGIVVANEGLIVVRSGET